MNPRQYKPLVLVAAVLLSSCDTILSPEEDRRVGVIAFYDMGVTIGAPDTVQMGVPFEISIMTYGNGCMSEGATEVRVRGLQVDVTPYDIHSGARVCTDILNSFPHKTTVTLPTPGLARFLFHGEQTPENHRITVGRDVFVKGPGD